MARKNLTAYLTVRVTQGVRDKFHKKARQYGDPAIIHRELLDAFIDGRMTIRPNPTKSNMENLYHDE